MAGRPASSRIFLSYFFLFFPFFLLLFARRFTQVFSIVLAVQFTNCSLALIGFCLYFLLVFYRCLFRLNSFFFMLYSFIFFALFIYLADFLHSFPCFFLPVCAFMSVLRYLNFTFLFALSNYLQCVICMPLFYGTWIILLLLLLILLTISFSVAFASSFPSLSGSLFFTSFPSTFHRPRLSSCKCRIWRALQDEN